MQESLLKINGPSGSYARAVRRTFMALLPTLFLSLCAAQAEPLQAPAVEPLIREGEHLRLVSHLQDPHAADQALRVVEATWKAAQELYGFDVPEDAVADGKRYEVHLYPGVASYRAADRKLTGGNFARNLAFAHYDSISAHVALQPPLKASALQVLGLPRQTQRLLAHEAAHLYRFATCPNFRSHPAWLADGVASHLELKVLKELGVLGDWSKDPYVSTSLSNVQALLEEGGFPTLDAILLDQTGELPFYRRYDTRWIAVEFLAGEAPEMLKALLQDTRRLGGGEGFAARLLASVEEEIGAEERTRLDQGLRAYVGGFKPQWFELYRALFPFEGALAQASFDSNAIAWRQDASGEIYRIAGSLTVLAGDRTQLNVFLGRSAGGFHSVAFTAGYGVTLFAYESGSNRWTRLGTQEVPALKKGAPLDFAVAVDGDKVTVHLEGEEVLALHAKGLPLDGPWGLSAQQGSAGIWRIEEAPGW